MTIRIGISVVTHQGQNIWQNGLGQNVIFLAEALQTLPFVESVSLIDVGDQNAMPPQVDASAKGLRILRAPDATDQIDVVMEMGGALDTQWLDLMRARGKKVFFLPEVREVHHLTGRNPRGPSTARQRVAERAIRAGQRVVPASIRAWISGRHHFGTHTPEQLDRLRHHYAYWQKKWGWDLINPDMAAIDARWGDTEIWWASDPARRATGEKIIETFRSAAPMAPRTPADGQ